MRYPPDDDTTFLFAFSSLFIICLLMMMGICPVDGGLYVPTHFIVWLPLVSSTMLTIMEAFWELCGSWLQPREASLPPTVRVGAAELFCNTGISG